MDDPQRRDARADQATMESEPGRGDVEATIAKVREQSSIDLHGIIRSRVDGIILLTLWAIRKLTLPLILVGFAFILVWFYLVQANADAVDQRLEELDQLDSFGAYLGAFLSPTAPIVLALLIRIVTGIIGLLVALPLTRWITRDYYPANGRFISFMHMLSDRWNLASAYRALRWTWAGRSTALEVVGERTARKFEIAQTIRTILVIAGWVGIVGTIVILSINGQDVVLEIEL